MAEQEPVYFEGGPFDGTLRMVPVDHSFMVVANDGSYVLKGKWGAFRNFVWQPVEERANV